MKRFARSSGTPLDDGQVAACRHKRPRQHSRLHLREQSCAANAVVDRVLRTIDRLDSFPRSGRLGQVSGTRELVVPGLPYIIVYADHESAVEVIAVFHGAQDR